MLAGGGLRASNAIMHQGMRRLRDVMSAPEDDLELMGQIPHHLALWMTEEINDPGSMLHISADNILNGDQELLDKVIASQRDKPA